MYNSRLEPLRPMTPFISTFRSALLLALLTAGTASATSYVMVQDDDLHRQAAVVARVEVLTTSQAPTAGTPATDYIVLVERLLKGDVSGTTIVVRVPGGVRADGLALWIDGAPAFESGDRALLFLVPRDDGTYGILHMMLGAFVERRLTGAPEGRPLAVRQLEGAVEVGRGGSGLRLARDWDDFESWLADRSAGRLRDRDYLVPEPSLESPEQFSNLIKYRGNPVRWFEFDDTRKVIWLVGRGSRKAKRAFRRAINAWNKDPDTCVEYRAKGRTSVTAGHSASDGVNAIVFDDPNNSIEGTFSCDGGGVIAAASVWYFLNPPLVQKVPSSKGKGRANVTLEADIVTNDGAACLISGKLKASEQVFGHELGHTLGLDHACGDDASGSCSTPAKLEALMRATFHEDGRGAELSAWDRKWLAKLY